MKLSARDGRTVSARRLRPGDLKALQAFDRGLSPETRHFFLPHQYDKATLEKVVARAEREDDVVYVLTSDSLVVGYFFLWYARRRVPLLGIGLADAYQGQGLGPQMMQILIDEAKRLGAEGIELTTDLRNERAFALYRSCGFRYLRDVDNVVGDGSIRKERCMFLALKKGALPMCEPHAPPV